MGDADDAGVWKAISWEGDLEVYSLNNENRLSDDEFKLSLKRVLNPVSVPSPTRVITDVTISVLNDLISPAEI